MTYRAQRRLTGILVGASVFLALGLGLPYVLG